MPGAHDPKNAIAKITPLALCIFDMDFSLSQNRNRRYNEWWHFLNIKSENMKMCFCVFQLVHETRTRFFRFLYSHTQSGLGVVSFCTCLRKSWPWHGLPFPVSLEASNKPTPQPLGFIQETPYIRQPIFRVCLKASNHRSGACLTQLSQYSRSVFIHIMKSVQAGTDSEQYSEYPT
jgi:hypothetical protein